MRCPHCDTPNEADARFCERCGGALAGPADATLPFEPGTVVPEVAEGPLLQLARRELAADYDVEREVGRGGMAIVYRAVERSLNRPVALKVLPPELALGASVVGRFKREAQMAASLDHPNIIPVYRVGESGSLLYLSMKFVEGRPIDAIIAGQGALPIPVVLLVLRAATAALAYAHEHGIVHRDIKGGNILVDRDGRVIVTDFGVARAVENASATATGSVIGTPYFMSPEQCAGKVAGPQSDQYSLGVVAFQMLTGTVPFQAETLAAIMHHHFFTPVPDVSVARSDVPAGLTAVLRRVLTKDPAERYPTTRDMQAAIDAIPLSDAERRDGEGMLRDLANGTPVRLVATAALPPLVDTMTIVTAQDAQRRSAEQRAGRRRWTAGAIVGLSAAAVVGLLAAPRRSTPVTTATIEPRASTQAPVSPAASAPATPASTTPSTTPPSGVARTTTGTPATGSPSGVGGGSTATVAAAKPAGAVTGGGSGSIGARATRLLRGVMPVAADSATPVRLPSGKLRVRVLPGDATISIDGRLLGQSAVIDSAVPAGRRVLHVAAAGYQSFDTTITLVADSTTVLGTVTLKPQGP
jgi:hypothetical protein